MGNNVTYCRPPHFLTHTRVALRCCIRTKVPPRSLAMYGHCAAPHIPCFYCMYSKHLIESAYRMLYKRAILP